MFPVGWFGFLEFHFDAGEEIGAKMLLKAGTLVDQNVVGQLVPLFLLDDGLEFRINNKKKPGNLEEAGIGQNDSGEIGQVEQILAQKLFLGREIRNETAQRMLDHEQHDGQIQVSLILFQIYPRSYQRLRLQNPMLRQNPQAQIQHVSVELLIPKSCMHCHKTQRTQLKVFPICMGLLRTNLEL